MRFKCVLWLGATLGLAGMLAAVVAPPAATASARLCHGVPVTKSGTKHHDIIFGTKHRDVIAGRGGSDAIIGRGGNDLICGGRGGDAIDGGPGLDTVYGGRGWNTCFAPTLFEHRHYHHGCQEHALLPTGRPRHPSPTRAPPRPSATPLAAVAAPQQQQQTPQFDPGRPVCTYGEIHLGTVAARPIYAGGYVAIATQLGVQTPTGISVIKTEPYTSFVLPSGGLQSFAPIPDLYDVTPGHWLIQYAVWFWDGARWVDGAWHFPAIYGYRSPTGGAFETGEMAFCEAQ